MEENAQAVEEVIVEPVALPEPTPVTEPKSKKRPRSNAPTTRALKKQIKELEEQLATAGEAFDAEANRSEAYFNRANKAEQELNELKRSQQATLTILRNGVNNLADTIALISFNGGK